MAIRVKEGRIYVCSNEECRAEIEIATPEENEGRRELRCRCGATMKRRYQTPELKALRKREAEYLLRKIF